MSDIFHVYTAFDNLFFFSGSIGGIFAEGHTIQQMVTMEKVIPPIQYWMLILDKAIPFKSYYTYDSDFSECFYEHEQKN